MVGPRGLARAGGREHVGWVRAGRGLARTMGHVPREATACSRKLVSPFPATPFAGGGDPFCRLTEALTRHMLFTVWALSGSYSRQQTLQEGNVVRIVINR